MVTISLLLSIITIPGTFAYVSSSSGLSAVTTPTFLPAPIKPQAQSDRRSTYDLGLGKNKPVYRKANNHDQPLSTQDAVKFWMVDEAENSYPSPLPKSSTSERKKPQPIIPIRLGQDVVEISSDDDVTKATFTVSPVDLDLNTLWVEMFIHDQRKTLVISDNGLPLQHSL